MNTAKTDPMTTDAHPQSLGCVGDWTQYNGLCRFCRVHRNHHFGARPILVYSFRPIGAYKARRFAVATGDNPADVVTTHGTEETAIKAAQRLAKKLGRPGVSVEN